MSSTPADRARRLPPRPVPLRLTLALLVLAAALYVAAISIYIAIQIAPTAVAFQNFRQETTVRHDSSERLAALDTALRDAQRLLASDPARAAHSGINVEAL